MASREVDHKRVQKLIFDALHRETTLPTAAAVTEMQAEDWDYFLDVAKRHRLGALLHQRMEQRPELMVPPAVRDQLKAAHRNSAMRSLVLYRELVNVTRLLENAGIPSIALKGAYLAQFAYPNPALRPMRDLDLLLKPEQIVAAWDLLKNQGYQPLYDGLPESYLTHCKDLPPLLSPNGVNLELHHKLFDVAPNDVGYAAYQSALFENSICQTISGTQIRFLGIEDLLVHLCVHAASQHHFNLGPLALSDIVYLTETHAIDWQDFMRKAFTEMWRRCAFSVFYLAKHNLGAKIPDEVMVALTEQNKEICWIDSAEYLLFSELADHKLITPNVRKTLAAKQIGKKCYALLGAAFPSRSMLAKEFPVSADSIAIYWHYPLRWHRLLFKALPQLIHGFSEKQSFTQVVRHQGIFSNWLRLPASVDETK